ncbi:MAG: rod-binding protein [Minwuia sp.]|uniref:rod-binding protein n=1 Tax=Minwuia sp. TaxID=2493630 RepID=UPI003A8C4268
MSDFIDRANYPRNVVPATPADPVNAAQRRARETAEDFESVFISQMLQHMNMGIDPEGPFGGGKGEEAYKSLVAEKYGEAITEMGGIGIADAIYKEILRLQEVGS